MKLKQKKFSYKNVTWTESDLATLLGQFIGERKQLLTLQFAGLATRQQNERIQDLNNRIKSANQLLAIGRAA